MHIDRKPARRARRQRQRDEAAALRHADFAESERFDGRVLTNFEKKGLAAGRVIHDFTYRRV